MSNSRSKTFRLGEASAIFYYGENPYDRERRIVDAYTATLEQERDLQNNPQSALGIIVLGTAVDDLALNLCEQCPLFGRDQRYSSTRHLGMLERSSGGTFFGKLLGRK